MSNVAIEDKYEALLKIGRDHLSMISDLETLIDFCNEAAGSGAKEVIRDAHDIMHVLFGGDRTREWAWVADWLNLPTNPRWTTDAWPDVKIRMLDVFVRAGGSLKREE